LAILKADGKFYPVDLSICLKLTFTTRMRQIQNQMNGKLPLAKKMNLFPMIYGLKVGGR
jgi:hypothetical protein